MKTFKHYLPILLTLALSTGCGGDGSDDDLDSNPNQLFGTWSGAVTKVKDTCADSTALQTVTFTDQVTRDGNEIELVTDTGVKYFGNAVGDNGFSVDASVGTVENCTQAGRIEFDQIDGNDDNTASVERFINVTCGSTSACEIAYTGTATRGGVNPTPAPGATATPTGKTGCNAMNPNTASGVFEGDGGCGISETALSLGTSDANSTVVLNTFGANGLTTFTVNNANPAAAASVRTDLTLKGEAGYACSMACSPPGTFTVTCNKEGGTQCVEKF